MKILLTTRGDLVNSNYGFTTKKYRVKNKQGKKFLIRFREKLDCPSDEYFYRNKKGRWCLERYLDATGKSIWTKFVPDSGKVLATKSEVVLWNEFSKAQAQLEHGKNKSWFAEWSPLFGNLLLGVLIVVGIIAMGKFFDGIIISFKTMITSLDKALPMILQH